MMKADNKFDSQNFKSEVRLDFECQLGGLLQHFAFPVSSLVTRHSNLHP